MSSPLVERREYYAGYMDAWFNKNVEGLSTEETVNLLGQTLAVLWESARKTLSEVTLMAVMDRVILINSESFSFLSLVKVELGGVRVKELERTASLLRKNAVVGAAKDVLTDFLTIIGNITGEVISRTLITKLSRVISKDSLSGFKKTRKEGKAI
ncbi:MAG: hypothetical protein ABIQ95_02310 [Bdellovibrionia bacterium]